jgi:hypothetical protein
LTQPPGYRGPLDPGRDPNLVMRDGVAQNLIAEICWLHEELLAKLDRDIERAALPNTEPASGRVTGSSDHDQMEACSLAVAQAQRDRDRQRKNALGELRRIIAYYEERLGRRPPKRPPVQSIDYQADGKRRVG